MNSINDVTVDAATAGLVSKGDCFPPIDIQRLATGRLQKKLAETLPYSAQSQLIYVNTLVILSFPILVKYSINMEHFTRIIINLASLMKGTNKRAHALNFVVG